MKCPLIFTLVFLGVLCQYSDFDDSMIDAISQYVSDKPETECSVQLQQLMDSSNPFALPFLDAMGKTISGATVGDLAWFGNYQLCTELQDLSTGLLPCKTTGAIKFENKTMPGMLIWTTCLPAQCQDEFVDIMADTISIYGNTLSELNNNTGHNLTTVCQEDIEYDAGAYVAIVTCSAFLLMTTIGTLWSPVERYIKAFNDEMNCRIRNDVGDTDTFEEEEKLKQKTKEETTEETNEANDEAKGTLKLKEAGKDGSKDDYYSPTSTEYYSPTPVQSEEDNTVALEDIKPKEEDKVELENVKPKVKPKVNTDGDENKAQENEGKCIVIEKHVVEEELYYSPIVEGGNQLKLADLKDNDGIEEETKEKTEEAAKKLEDLEENKTSENEDQPPTEESESETKKESIIATIFKCFALQQNIQTMMDTRTKPGQVLCMNGIRVLSIGWVVIGHMYLIPVVVSLGDLYHMSKVTDRVSFDFILNPFASVDSFFVMSGFLVSYLMVKHFHKGEKFRRIALGYYIHRYIRLTVPYAVVILVQGFLYRQYIDGPFTDNIILGHETCKKWWWTNLLYINNFVPWSLPAQCISQSWYLANDMQFFVIAPIFIVLLWTKPLVGNILCWGCVGASMTASGIATYFYEWNSTPMRESIYSQIEPFRDSLGGELFVYSYTKPYFRIVPYIVGIYGGWFYFMYKDKLMQITQAYKIRKLAVSVCLWAVTLLVQYQVIFGLHSDPDTGTTGLSTDYDPEAQEALSQTVPNAVLSKIGWALALVTQIVMCELGMGGPINVFLSWRGWLPLSRLTFSVYLLHYGINLVLVTQLRHVFSFFPDLQPVVVFLGLFCVVHLASAVLFLLVEQPVANLERRFMTPLIDQRKLETSN